jgi:hypothetical protein
VRRYWEQHIPAELDQQWNGSSSEHEYGTLHHISERHTGGIYQWNIAEWDDGCWWDGSQQCKPDLRRCKATHAIRRILGDGGHGWSHSSVAMIIACTQQCMHAPIFWHTFSVSLKRFRDVCKVLMALAEKDLHPDRDSWKGWFLDWVLWLRAWEDGFGRSL